MLRLTSLLWLLLCAPVASQGKNLLFYGNSLTYYVWGYGVPEVVRWIAIEAGHPAPTIRASYTGGGTLQYFATDPSQIAVISNSLPPGEMWDEVVMQGHLLEATNGIGFNSAVFLASAPSILTNVRNHSPAARAVMFQTWACSYGQMYYPAPWVDPMAMHTEVRDNYHQVVSNLNTTFGAGSAVLAAVGDAVSLLEWHPAWYEADLFHPNPAMILLTGMCIYSSIYGEPVCGIQPSFQPPGVLAQALQPYGLGEVEWQHLAGIADRSAAPASRRYPGSNDYLLLETATGASAVSACPDKRVTLGTPLHLQVRSLNGVFDNAPGMLLIDFFPTGLPSGPSPIYPEVQVNLGNSWVLATSAQLTNPLAWSFPTPISLLGWSVLVQGVALQSCTVTGNPLFATTDGHELVFF